MLLYASLVDLYVEADVGLAGLYADLHSNNSGGSAAMQLMMLLLLACLLHCISLRARGGGCQYAMDANMMAPQAWRVHVG